MKKTNKHPPHFKEQKKKVFKVSIIGASSSNYGFYIKNDNFCYFTYSVHRFRVVCHFYGEKLVLVSGENSWMDGKLILTMKMMNDLIL